MGRRQSIERRVPPSADGQFQPARWDEVEWRAFDAVFLALHGGAGEDGTLQGYFERQGIAYTGPDSAAARAAMSKSASKARFRACGVPTPASRAFDRRTQVGELARMAGELGYPLIVKPDAQGSSLGVSLVWAADELPGAARQALQCDAAGLLEAFVPGREFTLALVDRRPLPLVEVCSREEIFSYAEKYDAAAPHYRFDSNLPAEVEHAIVAAAVAAAEALAADGLVRVDLRLDRRDRPWVLELNATPGMTETSLAPAAARQAGIEIEQLCDSLLQSCLQRRTDA